MANKIRSLVGALAIAGAVNAADTNSVSTNVVDNTADTNRVKIIEGPILNYDTEKVKLVALFPAGHTNKYTLQTRTNMDSGEWEDSASNTNVYNWLLDSGITNRSSNVGIYETLTDVKKRFYRLRSN